MKYPASVDEVIEVLREQSYLADRGLATAIYLGISLGRPILLEGEPGVGKTEMAKALAAAFDAELIRLQCYEGIDANQALYEWDYTRQLLYVRALSEKEASGKQALHDLFGPEFLVERPLLKATRAGSAAVLLVDEIDRADDEFEAFLLEVLSDFQVTIPEIGTVVAEDPPIVIITSNRTRELHDALKRRCLYHWIDYPSPQREADVVRVRAPEVSDALAGKVVEAVTNLRRMDLVKKPGLAETIDWARALAFLGADNLDPVMAEETLGSVIKDHDDFLHVRKNLGEVVR